MKSRGKSKLPESLTQVSYMSHFSVSPALVPYPSPLSDSSNRVSYLSHLLDTPSLSLIPEYPNRHLFLSPLPDSPPWGPFPESLIRFPYLSLSYLTLLTYCPTCVHYTNQLYQYPT